MQFLGANCVLYSHNNSLLYTSVVFRHVDDLKMLKTDSDVMVAMTDVHQIKVGCPSLS